jgi:hypothetical protein
MEALSICYLFPVPTGILSAMSEFSGPTAARSTQISALSRRVRGSIKIRAWEHKLRQDKAQRPIRTGVISALRAPSEAFKSRLAAPWFSWTTTGKHGVRPVFRGCNHWCQNLIKGSNFGGIQPFHPTSSRLIQFCPTSS